MVIYKLHTSPEELLGIQQLQSDNLKVNLTEAEALSQGFVTLSHTINQLTLICGEEAHVIAVHQGKIVGYTLTMLSQFRNVMPLLANLYRKLDILNAQEPYLVMGQVCIDKSYRGQDLFSGLYNKMKDEFNEKYPGIYTEIAVSNGRSIRAHEKVGFEEVERYENSEGELWSIVYWDWLK